MEKVNPKTLSGMMELLPEDQILFNSLIDKIRKTYEKFGYLPLDTPVMEYSEVLLAKAGGDTAKEVYRFKKGDTDISLRFDLTVPLAKYVSQKGNDLVFPFKRYQIGKVYRGERPQKGRYREFYQCDIDVIGKSLNPLYDAEMPAIIYELFRELDFGKFTIRINNRKILNGLFKNLGVLDKSTLILRLIDKLAKIGEEEVKKELKDLDLEEKAVNKIIDFISIKGTVMNVLDSLENLGIVDEEFTNGIYELKTVVNALNDSGIDQSYYTIDLTIARGLDYYTGTVYETTLDDYPSLGSICSGGRYDNLTSCYTDEEYNGVGISIGLTRLFSQLKEIGIISSSKKCLTSVLVVPFSNDNINYSNSVAKILRDNDIITEVYYNDTSFKKKLNYANRLGIEKVLIIGEDEEKEGKVTIKDMESGDQETVLKEDILKELKK